MLFNSFDFLVFFPIVTTLYFLLPHRFRAILLLFASCIFYMVFIPIYILILFILIVIDYFAGILIESAYGKSRKYFLALSIFANVGMLAIFKYYNFINVNLSALAQVLHFNYPLPMLGIILPIGLSFHTFQAMSYTIEVFRGNRKAERNFLIYALYVMFYPQLVAGPIERPQNLIHQFYEEHKFDLQRILDGLKLMLWGLFKKIVIADRLAIVVNLVYNDPRSYSGIPLIIATIFFAFQIYCDFSGYSDIAIGAAQVMGFKLMDNFNRPYFSKSIGEFWKRWHISLSSWFRDYFYISLGGNRVPKWRWEFNLFITFLISGLWHGANWTYIIWGALNGLYLIFSIWTEKPRHFIEKALKMKEFPHIHKYLQVGTTFVLTCFAWIFFRATNISDALYIISHLFVPLRDLVPGMGHFFYQLSLLRFGPQQFMISIISIGLMEYVHLIQRHSSIRHMLMNRPLIFRTIIYVLFLASILLFGKFNSLDFIYFQF